MRAVPPVPVSVQRVRRVAEQRGVIHLRARPDLSAHNSGYEARLLIMSQNLPAVRAGSGVARTGPDITYEVINHLREELGAVRLGRSSRAPTHYRLDLLAEALDKETFQAAMKWLSSGKRSSRVTRRNYADDLRVWAAFSAELGYGPLRLGGLSYEDITTWKLLQESRGAKPRTVARRVSSLSSFHEHAKSRGWDGLTNPIDREDHRPKIDRHDTSSATPILEKDEIRAVAASAANPFETLTVRLLYTLAGRVSEMCAADVDKRVTRGGRICLDLTRKGGKSRIIPLSSSVAALLDDHIGGRTTDALLLNPATDTRIDRFEVDRILTRLGRRAGVLPGRDLTPHVLRASRITHMIDDKEPLAEIQAFADHSDPVTTIGYFTRRQATERNGRLVDKADELFK